MRNSSEASGVTLPAVSSHVPSLQITVLIVDDEAPVSDLMGALLDTWGYQVLVAGTAKAALDLARVHPRKIDLLIADFLLPDMSGQQLADAFKICRPETRILYVSGYGEEFVLDGASNPLSAAFLEKPFTPSGLAQAVQAVLSN